MQGGRHCGLCVVTVFDVPAGGTVISVTQMSVVYFWSSSQRFPYDPKLLSDEPVIMAFENYQKKKNIFILPAIMVCKDSGRCGYGAL